MVPPKHCSIWSVSAFPNTISTRLMVPPSIATSGMTLNASPARSIVTLTTPEESGEVSRETSVCVKAGARVG